MRFALPVHAKIDRVIVSIGGKPYRKIAKEIERRS
jgi:hypothetical protein